MKRKLLGVFVLLLVIIIVDSLLAMFCGRGIFTINSRKEYEYTNELKALSAFQQFCFLKGDFEQSKFFILRFQHIMNGKSKISIYMYKPSNIIITSIIEGDEETNNNTIIAVVYRKETQLPQINEQKKIIYPILLSRGEINTFMTVESNKQIFPGDIYKDGKITSVYNNLEKDIINKALNNVMSKME